MLPANPSDAMKSSPIPAITDAVALAEVRTIYRDLEARPVERACRRVAKCCHFKLTGKTPFLTAGEALLAATALRATGRTRLSAKTGGACPLFDQTEARCLIYEARPFGCRTHFCAAAGGPYARTEVIDLIHRLEDLDLRLGGDGSRPLPAMIEEGLRKVGSRRS
jgi:Fe-S-cluster containining protein